MSIFSRQLKGALIAVSIIFSCIVANAQTITGPASACAGDPLYFSVNTFAATDTLQWYYSKDGSSWHKYKETTHNSCVFDEMPSDISYQQGGDYYFSVYVEKLNKPETASNVASVKLLTTNCNETVCRQTSTGDYYFGTDFDPTSGSYGQDYSGSNVIDYFPEGVILETGMAAKIIDDNMLVDSPRDYNHNKFAFPNKPHQSKGNNSYIAYNASNGYLFQLKYDNRIFKGKAYSMLIRVYFYKPSNCDQNKFNFKLEGSYGNQVTKQKVYINIWPDSLSEYTAENRVYHEEKSGNNQPEIHVGETFNPKKNVLYRMDINLSGIFGDANANFEIQPRIESDCYKFATDFVSFESQTVCVTPRVACVGNYVTVNAAGFPYDANCDWQKWDGTKYKPLENSEVIYIQDIYNHKRQANILVSSAGTHQYRVKATGPGYENVFVDFTLTGEDCADVIKPEIEGDSPLCLSSSGTKDTFTIKNQDALAWMEGTVSWKWKLIHPLYRNANINHYITAIDGNSKAVIQFADTAAVNDTIAKPYKLVMTPTQNGIEMVTYQDSFDIYLYRKPDVSKLSLTPYDICPKSTVGRDTVALTGMKGDALYKKLGYNISFATTGDALNADSSGVVLDINQPSFCSLTSDANRPVKMYIDNNGCKDSIETNVKIKATEDPTIQCGPDKFYAASNDDNCNLQYEVPTLVSASVTCGDYTITVKMSNSNVTNQTVTIGEQVTLPMGVTSFVYTITDGCGKTDFCTQTVTVSDQDAPRFIQPIPTDVPGLQDNCLENANISELLTNEQLKARLADCSEIIVSHEDETTTSGCNWTITRTYTIKDEHNNIYNGIVSMSVSGKDQTAPALNASATWPANITGQDNCYAAANSNVLASDNDIKALFEDCSAITVTHTDNKTGNDCAWTITRTFTIKDACNNIYAGPHTQSVSGGDRSAPTLKSTSTLPDNITEQDRCFANADTTGLLDASEMAAFYEDCNTFTVTTSDEATATSNCGWTWVRTYTITDACGNTVSPAPTMSVSGSDRTAPQFQNGAGFNHSINGQNRCYNNIDLSVLDTDESVKGMYTDCGSITVSHVDNPSGNNCGWNVQRVFTVSDGCNNTTLYQSLSGSDQNKPHLKDGSSLPTNEGQTVCFNDRAAAPATDVIKALYEDDCSNITVSYAGETINESSNCGWETTYNYTISDGCSVNDVTVNLLQSGADNSAPTYTGTMTNITQEGCTTSDLPAAATTIADLEEVTGLTFSDNCTAHDDLTVSSTDGALSGECAQSMVRTYTVTDDCGKYVSVKQTITLTVPDNITITGSNSSTVDCPADAVAPHTVTGRMPSVTDACGKDISNNYTLTTDASPVACRGTMSYVYTFTDCANHTKEWTYTYTISAPQVTLPATGSQQVPCAIDATKPGAPALQDNCGRDMAVAYKDSVASIGADGNGTVTHTYTYTDCTNQTYDWEFIYTVKASSFTAIPNAESNIHCANEATTPATPNTTICGQPIVFTKIDESSNVSDEGCGDITYTYSYTVNATNYTWKYTYHVSPEDFSIPTNVETSKVVECVAEAVAPATPVVTNNCGTTITPVLRSGYPTSLPDGQCEGNIEYIYDYTDCAGHTHAWTYTYTVDRTTKPSEYGTPVANSSTAACESEATAPSTLPVVKDICGTTLSPDGEPTTSGTFDSCSGTKIYTYTYTDCAGLSFTWSYTYTINKPSEPTLAAGKSWPADQLNINGCYNALPSFPADNDIKDLFTAFCDKQISVSSEEVSGDTKTDNCDWQMTRKYTITDGCNTFDRTITYGGKDQSAPVLNGTLPGNITGQNSCFADADDSQLKSTDDIKELFDDCSGIIVTYTDNKTGDNCNWTITRTYTVKDECGNTYTPAPTMSISGGDQNKPQLKDGSTLPTNEGQTVCFSDRAAAPTT
ncbi:MAG: hypothetical protein IJ916_06065, partial [Paludibacteraceae bacterium]|nr:hypothetical protein [Paludibacteraceae bacterium]